MRRVTAILVSFASYCAIDNDASLSSSVEAASITPEACVLRCDIFIIRRTARDSRVDLPRGRSTA